MCKKGIQGKPIDRKIATYACECGGNCSAVQVQYTEYGEYRVQGVSTGRRNVRAVSVCSQLPTTLQGRPRPAVPALTRTSRARITHLSHLRAVTVGGTAGWTNPRGCGCVLQTRGIKAEFGGRRVARRFMIGGWCTRPDKLSSRKFRPTTYSRSGSEE